MRIHFYTCLLLLAAACTSPEQLYQQERAEEIALAPAQVDSVTATRIATLPPTLQRYLEVCGYLNRPIAWQADIRWEKSYLKLGLGKEWGEMSTQQFNSVQPLARLAYMDFLSMPMSGRDRYSAGEGEMKSKLFDRFTLVEGAGRAHSQSALITVFAEFMLLPGYLLQEYVRWEELQPGVVRGHLRHGDFEVVGDFYFDESGFFKRFETNDRYYDMGKGRYKKMPFHAFVDGYQENNGIKIAKNMRAVWVLEEDGAFEYFRGRIAGIDYHHERL